MTTTTATTATLNAAAATRRALAAALDDGAVLVGPTVGYPGSPTEGLKGELIAVPSGDRGAVALAVGLALGGRRVVLELPSARHLAAAADELASAARLAATEHRVTLVVRVPYGAELGAFDAPVGHVLADIDGLAVVCPSQPGDFAGLLHTALSAPGVTVLLEPRALAARRGPVGDGPVPFQPRLVRDGQHVTLASWGTGVAMAEAAADTLQGDGISAMVVDLVALAPVPLEQLGDWVRATGRLVVVHPDDDALADRIRRVGLDAAFLHLESPLARVTAEPSRIVRTARDTVHY
jgi:pyruvate dehydrogenase E1 component beta subunit